MEILNNIWLALTSENEILTKIITFPLTFIEVTISLYICIFFFKKKLSKKQKNMYILLLSVLSIITNFFIKAPLSLFIHYILMYLILKFIFKFTFVQIIEVIIVPFTIFGLTNSLIMNPLLKLFKITLNQLLIVPIYRFMYLSCTYISIWILLYFLKKINLTFSISDIKLNNKLLVTNLAFGLITLFIQAILDFYYINNVPIIFTLFNFILLLAYFFFNFYSLYKAIKLEITTKELENAESYNNSLTILYDNVRGFKHDFDNMINIIGGYIKSNDIDGLKQYYSSLENDYNRVKNIQMLNPNIINNPGIYNLLVAKYKKATDLDVKINFEFFFDFKNLKMPIYEFSRILGILLDNAIEAAKDCENKEVYIVFRESRKQHVQIIIIENTYLIDSKIDMKNIFEKGISGKKNHTGIGLWEVNNIVKRFNNVILNTTKDDKYFKQELQIYF